ncbi:MAG: hypothetical protein U0802_19085 [Candidatus Binatia bacterium]
MYAPVAMTVGDDGTLVVGQADGTLLLLRLDGPAFAPRFVAAFAAVDALPGISLDGAERVVVPTGQVCAFLETATAPACLLPRHSAIPPRWDSASGCGPDTPAAASISSIAIETPYGSCRTDASSAASRQSPDHRRPCLQ